MPDGSVTVVLPCLNEAASLPGVLAAMPNGYRPLVVDNNSTDGTAEVARRHGADVVTERRPGYGSAVHAGVEAATTSIVAVVDADGSLDPAELPALVTPPRVPPLARSSQHALDGVERRIEFDSWSGLCGQREDRRTVDGDGSGRLELDGRVIGQLLLQRDRGRGGRHDARACSRSRARRTPALRPRIRRARRQLHDHRRLHGRGRALRGIHGRARPATAARGPGGFEGLREAYEEKDAGHRREERHQSFLEGHADTPFMNTNPIMVSGSPASST